MSVPNSTEIGQTAFEASQFFDQDGATVRHLGFYELPIDKASRKRPISTDGVLSSVCRSVRLLLTTMSFGKRCRNAVWGGGQVY